MDQIRLTNTLLIQQAISLFDLLPCRTTELQIAGDWLENQGLHSFIANVVRQGKWVSFCLSTLHVENNQTPLRTLRYTNQRGGAGSGAGRGNGENSGGKALERFQNGRGDGNGVGFCFGVDFIWSQTFCGRGIGYGSGCGGGTGIGTG